MKSLDKLKTIVCNIDENKGEEIVVLNLAKVSGFTDYFVISTGLNKLHNQALADHVSKSMKTTYDENELHLEGVAAGEWILMDYGDIVVHIFTKEQRQFYNLEKLWGDAEILDVSDWLV